MPKVKEMGKMSIETYNDFVADLQSKGYTKADADVEWAYSLIGAYGFDTKGNAELKEEEGDYTLAIIEKRCDDWFVRLGRRKESDRQRLFWEATECFSTHLGAETFADGVACTVIEVFGNDLIG